MDEEMQDPWSCHATENTDLKDLVRIDYSWKRRWQPEADMCGFADMNMPPGLPNAYFNDK